MAEDFRKKLKESMRNDATGERWFDDLDLGEVLYLSIQASALHGCTPAALLDDLSGYDAFQVTLQIKPKVMTFGRRGVLPQLESKPWWPLFTDDSPILYVAENVPAGTVQEIYEDLLTCLAEHPELAPRKCGCGLTTC
ncbi:MAG: hypothetical protein AUJ49_02410 [Desulfovibrionaceae bacterium CG1_02_65_16]|nr:MAG: hypothetical protein AUJ49_02410 [Desulfovibrionaceae bacterium CG1_02_65_16]